MKGRDVIACTIKSSCEKTIRSFREANLMSEKTAARVAMQRGLPRLSASRCANLKLAVKVLRIAAQRKPQGPRTWGEPMYERGFGFL